MDRRSFLRRVGVNAIAITAISSVSGLTSNAFAKEQSNDFLSPAEIMKKHAEAIEIGKTEYVEQVLLEEKFAGGRYAHKSDDWKRQKAVDYFDSQFNNFISGNDNGSLKRFVSRSPIFTSYILAFQNDFPLAGELQKEHQISELDNQIHASRERQKALKRLINTLSGG